MKYNGRQKHTDQQFCEAEWFSFKNLIGKGKIDNNQLQQKSKQDYNNQRLIGKNAGAVNKFTLASYGKHMPKLG